MSHPFPLSQHGPLQPVSRERLTDQTATALREYVLANRLAPGTRLPPETTLAARFGVSRNVLRQAVASLQGLGMLRVVQGSGTFVADVADADVFGQIAAWMGPDTLTEHDYLEVRTIWERGVYELAMERATDAELDELEELARALVDATDPEEEHDRHEEFHQALLLVTKNPFLVTIGTILHRFFWEFGYSDGTVRKPPARRVRNAHCFIVDTLRTRDRTKIARMTEMHLSPRLRASAEGEAGAMARPRRAP
jgi:GntR family transcriptional repressor for pyruvate dehydrogenase complex